MVKQLGFPLKKPKQTGQHSTPALSSPFTPLLLFLEWPFLQRRSQGEAPPSRGAQQEEAGAEN